MDGGIEMDGWTDGWMAASHMDRLKDRWTVDGHERFVRNETGPTEEQIKTKSKNLHQQPDRVLLDK